LGKRHCAYFIIYFAHSCVCGQQLQGYFCRVPFKWFFANRFLKSLVLVLVWFLFFSSSFFFFFSSLFLKVRYQLTLMSFHFHQKPRFYGQRAFTLFYVTHVSIILNNFIVILDHYQESFFSFFYF